MRRSHFLLRVLIAALFALTSGVVAAVPGEATVVPPAGQEGGPADLAPCRILMPQGVSLGTYQTNLWPDGIIHYQFNGNVSPTNQQRAIAAMAEIENVAGIDFVQRTSEPAYLHILSSNGNSSYVGRIGGRQDVNIYNWTYRFIICHELMHAAGLWHEQQRPDRDTYVRINWQNICQNCCGGQSCNYNFNIPGQARAHGAYDFDSVMHYGQYDFSGNGLPTITVLPPNESWQGRIGQFTHLSTGDGDVLEYLYPIGGGQSPVPCNYIRKLTGKCKKDTIKGKVVLWTNEYSGALMFLDVAGSPEQVVINGKKGKYITFPVGPGSHVAVIVDPADCGFSRQVDCP